MPPPELEFHRALKEAMFWDTMIQNNALRFSVYDIVDDESELTPGILAALEGFWRGRNRHINELRPKKDGKGGDKDASRRRK